MGGVVVSILRHDVYLSTYLSLPSNIVSSYACSMGASRLAIEQGYFVHLKLIKKIIEALMM